MAAAEAEESLYECNLKYNRIEHFLGDATLMNAASEVAEPSSSVPVRGNATFSTHHHVECKQESTENDDEFIRIDPEEDEKNSESLVQCNDESSLLEWTNIVNDSEGFSPWILGNEKGYPRSPFMRLHQEIVQFCDFISPTTEEHNLRLRAIEKVNQVAKNIWPSCRVEVFGSFASGLFLPSSDCDIVILDVSYTSEAQALKALARGLSKFGVGKDIKPILKARVPIVKFIESESNIAFDICLNRSNGIEAANYIRNAIQLLPPLRPLCLILKIFIQQRELNEVYLGGLGSFALTVMLIAHLQLHPSWKHYGSLEKNLGVLLLDFLELYGKLLNIRDVGVSCNNGGHFYSKKQKNFFDSNKPNLLSVEDPLDRKNDIGKSSFNIGSVRFAFMHAHRNLFSLNLEAYTSPEGLLSRIVRLDSFLTRRLKPSPNLIWNPVTYEIDPKLVIDPQTGLEIQTSEVHVNRVASPSAGIIDDRDDFRFGNHLKRKGASVDGRHHRWNGSEPDEMDESEQSRNKRLKRDNSFRSTNGRRSEHSELNETDRIGKKKKGKQKNKNKKIREDLKMIDGGQEETDIRSPLQSGGKDHQNEGKEMSKRHEDRSYVYDFFLDRVGSKSGKDTAADRPSNRKKKKLNWFSEKMKRNRQKNANSGHNHSSTNDKLAKLSKSTENGNESNSVRPS